MTRCPLVEVRVIASSGFRYRARTAWSRVSCDPVINGSIWCAVPPAVSSARVGARAAGGSTTIVSHVIVVRTLRAR